MNKPIKCAHCESTGSCHSGKDGRSCSTCVKEKKLKESQEHYGIVCSVCNGHGIAETKTARIHNRIVPILALLIVYVSLFIVWASMSFGDNLDSILPFAATLIGSVTGFYFGGRTKICDANQSGDDNSE